MVGRTLPGGYSLETAGFTNPCDSGVELADRLPMVGFPSQSSCHEGFDRTLPEWHFGRCSARCARLLLLESPRSRPGVFWRRG